MRKQNLGTLPAGGQLRTSTAKSSPPYNSLKRKRKAAGQTSVAGVPGAGGEPDDNRNARGGRCPDRNQAAERRASELLEFERRSMQAAQGMSSPPTTTLLSNHVSEAGNCDSDKENDVSDDVVNAQPRPSRRQQRPSAPKTRFKKASRAQQSEKTSTQRQNRIWRTSGPSDGVAWLLQREAVPVTHPDVRDFLLRLSAISSPDYDNAKREFVTALGSATLPSASQLAQSSQSLDDIVTRMERFEASAKAMQFLQMITAVQFVLQVQK
jgi:hypothetical protein